MNNIGKIIGNYQEFFSDLLHRMKKSGINIHGMPLSHLLYRTVTIPEYEKLREELKTYCSEFVETQFNGRAVSLSLIHISEPTRPY